MDRLPRARMISTLIAQQVRRPGFTARTHSVFHGALNLAAGEEVLTIAVPAVGALPSGLVLFDADDFLARGLAPGMLLRSNGTHLRCVDHPFGVDLTAACLWSPVLPALDAIRPLESAVGVLNVVLADIPGQGGLRPLLTGLVTGGSTVVNESLPFPCATAQPEIRQVLSALRTGRLADAVEAAQHLVGLGHGLTPSGDDFLVGVSAGLRATKHRLAESFATACATQARGRTTRIAQMFLDCAARGAYAARVHGVIAALAADVSADALSSCLAETLGWGETSGADCLLGVLGGTMLTGASSSPAGVL